MKTILELSHIKARQYFLESQNYCNMQFPKYIDFKPVIEYVQNSVGNKELRDILKDPKRMPSDYENVNHKMLVKKDAQYSYRPIQLINPYLYYLLVKAMTNKSSWKEIKDRFAGFFVKFGGNLFFISTVFFFLNPIKSCRYVCFLVTLKTPHH